MIDAPPRYTLQGTATHYPDGTWKATLQLDDGGRPVQVWTTSNHRTRQAALDNIATQYRRSQHLPDDTPIHAAITDQMADSLTPDCAGDNCICMKPPLTYETGYAAPEGPFTRRLRFMSILNRPAK